MTAELWAIVLDLKHVYCSRGRSFVILSDPLSSLQAIFNMRYDHPILVQILELCMNLTRSGRKTVFICVPGLVGIGGTLAADSAAKDVLVGNILVEFIPFSHLKSCANIYIYIY